VSNLTIEDLTIDGPNRSGEYREIYEAEHGFDIKGSTGVVIRASHVRQVYGDFVYVDDAGWPIGSGINVPTSDLLVSGNWFRTAGRHGLGVGGRATGVRFEGNIVRRVHRSGVDFELNPERTISDFEIVGNTFRDFRLNWIAAGEGGATDIYFGWNRILGDSMHSKIGPRTEPYIHERWVFEGNVSDTEHEGDRTVFFLQHVHDFTFVANVQPMYPGGGGRVFGIFGDVCGITLIDNVFANYKELFYPEEPPSC
jgi:hypothetical protein